MYTGNGWARKRPPSAEKGGGPALDALNHWGITAAAQRGIDIAMGARIGEMLQQAGINRVNAREVLIPLGKRGGRLGLMMEANYFSALENIRPLILALGLTDEETHTATLKQARLEVEQRRCGVIYYVAYGQRPGL